MVDTSDIGAVILHRIREEMGLEASARMADALAPQLREIAHLQDAAMRHESDPRFEEATIIAHEHASKTWRARVEAEKVQVAEAEGRVAARLLGHLEELAIGAGVPFYWTVEMDQPTGVTPEMLDTPVQTRRVKHVLPRENLERMFDILKDKYEAGRDWSYLDQLRNEARAARQRQYALQAAADDIALALREVGYLPADDAETIRAWALSCYDEACRRLDGDVLQWAENARDRHDEIERLRREVASWRGSYLRNEGTIRAMATWNEVASRDISYLRESWERAERQIERLTGVARRALDSLAVALRLADL